MKHLLIDFENLQPINSAKQKKIILPAENDKITYRLPEKH